MGSYWGNVLKPTTWQFHFIKKKKKCQELRWGAVRTTCRGLHMAHLHSHRWLRSVRRSPRNSCIRVWLCRHRRFAGKTGSVPGVDRGQVNLENVYMENGKVFPLGNYSRPPPPSLLLLTCCMWISINQPPSGRRNQKTSEWLVKEGRGESYPPCFGGKHQSG